MSAHRDPTVLPDLPVHTAQYGASLNDQEKAEGFFDCENNSLRSEKIVVKEE